MVFRDFTKTRSSIGKYDTDPIFVQLLKETVNRIHALRLFYEVGTKIRAKQAVKTPSCAIRPMAVNIAEHQISGSRYDLRFIINPCYVVKHPNDCILLQEVLYLSDKIRRSFAKGDSGPTLVFSSITGHYNTEVEPTIIEPVEFVTEDVLAFNSGVNIIFSVWTTF